MLNLKMAALEFHEMNLFKKIITISVILMGLSGPLRAEIQQISTVRDYHLNCGRDPGGITFLDGLDVGICLGFLRGISSFAQMNCDLTVGNIPSPLKADTTGVDFVAQQRAVVNWANNHPEYWDQKSSTLVLALSETWPCSN